jgi:HAD superfamily hydrolase (TIGR01509 family)
MSSSRISFPKAVLFDMDGTLTVPTFDFPGIRRALGLPPGAPILECIAKMEPEQQLAAEVILHRFEDEVAEKAPLADGCEQLLQFLLAKDIHLAVITRNRRQSVLTFQKRYPLPIDVWITREDGPHKPDPTSLLLACQRLGVRTQEAWMVGDGQFDVEAGINAGMPSIWLAHARPRTFAAEPWKTVETLRDLLDWCQNGG